MSQISSENTNELVVPKKALHAFPSAALENKGPAVLDKPNTRLGKMGYYLKKSTLVSAPMSVAAVIAGNMALVQATDFLSPGMTVFTVIGSVVAMSGGAIATLFSLDSVATGDMEYAPLPPTKQYLALKEAEKECVITPFDNWDNIFDKNSSPVG